MKRNKKILAFTLTVLASALTGCGGESANVIPEKNETTSLNGSCLSGSNGCFEFALDYPIDGLNFYCGNDTENSYVTLYDLNDGTSSGACKAGDQITFFLQGKDKHKVELGKFSLDKIGNMSVSQMPRLSILDIAEGIRTTGGNANLKTSREIAIRLIRIIQTIGLNVNPPQSSAALNSNTDIQRILINDSVRTQLDLMLSDITVDQFKNTTDSEFENLLSKWLDISKVSNAEAEIVLDKLLIISNAAVYQPEFSLFSTSDLINSYLSGSEGLVGCEAGQECKASNTTVSHLFGHFMLMTDRQGRTFGSGLQWRGIPQSAAGSTTGFETLGGLNAQLIRQVAPVQMTAFPQKSWIGKEDKAIPANPGFVFKTHDATAETMTIYQGRLYNDYMIAGTERFYKLLTGKKIEDVLTPAQKNELGLWKQSGGSKDYTGTMDLYKIYPISYLDNRVFKTKDNVQSGNTYIFPLYANLNFKFTDTSIASQTVPIVIDENGDIRTNFKPSSASVDECSATYDTATMQSNYGGTVEQQYPIGTVSRAFVANASSQPTDNTISIRLILGNQKFGNLNGALVGMNSTIKTSTDNTDAIVIGGALVKLQNLLKADENTALSSTSVSITDSSGATVKWANSFASFNKVFSGQNPNDTQSKELAKLSGGELDLQLASCYRVKKK